MSRGLISGESPNAADALRHSDEGSIPSSSIDLAPPMKLAHADELELGTWVTWTHEAAVARWIASKFVAPRDGIAGEWRLEGHGHWRPYMGPGPWDTNEFDPTFAEDVFWNREPHAPDFVNKTVVVWPAPGEGLIVGLARRGIGRSERSRPAGGHMAWGYDEGEQGGFAADAYVPLYAVKSVLQGVRLYFVPTWAVTPV